MWTAAVPKPRTPQKLCAARRPRAAANTRAHTHPQRAGTQTKAMDGGLAGAFSRRDVGRGGDGIPGHDERGDGHLQVRAHEPRWFYRGDRSDMTLSRNERCTKRWRLGEVTFLGQWEQAGVFLVAARRRRDHGDVPGHVTEALRCLQGRVPRCGRDDENFRRWQAGGLCPLPRISGFAQKKPSPGRRCPLRRRRKNPWETIDEGDEDSDSSSDGGEFEAESPAATTTAPTTSSRR